MNLHFLLEHQKFLKILHSTPVQIIYSFLIFKNFWSYRNIRSFPISTDSPIFDRFYFLCVVRLFWWMYGLYRGYEPWWSWNIVDIMLIWNWNEFTTVPKVSDLLCYTNECHEGFVKFCVDEVFEERGVTDVRRIKRGKSSSLGMPKARQVNIQGDSSV